MDKNQIKTLLKCIIWGLIWASVLFVIALAITKYLDYNFNDVLFIEGILLIILGVLSSVGGNPMGLSLQSLGQNNAQYVSNSNLEISKMEKSKNNLKTTISTTLSMVSFIVGGGIVILISFII